MIYTVSTLEDFVLDCCDWLGEHVNHTNGPSSNPSSQTP